MNDACISLHDVIVQLGDRTILDRISFEIPTGEFVAVLGPNGAGKSTLLKLLLGLLQQKSGDVSLFGRTPHRGNPIIGYAPQHRVLETDFALRARDVVGFGLDGHRWGIGLPNPKREQAINALLREVDALHLGNEPVGQLSGGEQQRLLIAQALISQPKILLLDEPLANLDINHAQEIVTLVAKICRERQVTVLFVAHDVNPLLPVAHSVLYLAHGHATLGHPDKVITSSVLTQLYETPIEVVRTADRVFVIGAEL